ncbi:3-oxoacyl-[acyl-carrier-protein] reductase [Desulfonema ishimotonii]|uniref:3-oxoacyl-[acyl-carrier-protein] reductase n=1 Tax=Desulfonema ishimotonii TaxID=45657 RepID=A0A401FX18_9BACT|nr:3-oxoacyl-[acyl-carrier-protein] reductase [Desulfonema ishimotonii]GBC61474.1 3-oxoacyl-[acyl-carrier-protein] reductase [Desulfonema ishimotonii]
MTEQTKRTVVVTGGSKGIGRAICLALAGPESRIYFNYASDSHGAEETEKQVRDAGGEAVAVKVDVASGEAVKAFFDRVLDETGRVDVLVNNAGITRDGLIMRMKEQDWDDVMAVNLRGTFHCSKIVSKAMLRQRSGRIINISSVVGVTGNPGQANYVAAKAGIIGLTKALARELASRGITVNAVAPGYVETDMTADLADRAKDAMISQVPLGRAGTPEDIAATVAFLASDQAAYITGQVIHVSGGMYM